LIIFLTFCVILSTLVLQGLTFPWLVRRLGVRETTTHHAAERTARHKLAKVALATLEAHTTIDEGEASGKEVLRNAIQLRIQEVEDEEMASLGWSRRQELALATRRLRLATLAAEREELFRQRLADESPDAVLLKLQQEIDFEEARLRS
jgi:CPA1 family monovalent cation:H+ antiporter